MESKHELISPYAFPGIRLRDLDPIQYPYLFEGPKRLTGEQILKIIADETSVNAEIILTKVRNRKVVYSRNIFQKILRTYGDNLSTIAEIVNTDHTTVIHSLKTFDQQYVLDEDYKNCADRIFNKVGINLQNIQIKPILK